MVVLSAAVCTKSGRALLSRQYVEMSRLRVEGFLNAFPKLVASEHSAGGGAGSKQHTFVETDNVRYVYLPLDASLYLLLVTNKGSNIVEDLDTLRLLSRVIPEQMGAGVQMTLVINFLLGLQAHGGQPSSFPVTPLSPPPPPAPLTS
jgi:hypothetical protein